MHRAKTGRGGSTMSANDPNGELGVLIGAMCDGTITADESGRLDTLLASNKNARQFYNNYMFLHAELYSQHASVEAVESDKDFGLERVGSSSTLMEIASEPARQSI